MLQLNENLFKALSQALRMTYKEISTQSGISITTLYRIIAMPIKISVQQLIDLANGLSIPVSRFISEDDSKEPIGQREDYIKSDDYKFCFYDKRAMQKVIDSDTILSYRDIASIVGLHPNRVKESLLAEHRLPVTRLLDFCNATKMDFFYFLVDPNNKSDNAQERKSAITTDSDYTAILHDIQSMLREQAVFRDEIRRDIARLDKKIDMFIDTYSEEITAPEEAKRIAVLAKQAAKEAHCLAEKQIANDEVLSLLAL